MVRENVSAGTESLSNGYVVVKQGDGSWEYKHHLIAVKKLGRPLRPDERVCFIDRNRQNFNPNNIEIRWKSPVKQYKRLAYLRRRIQETRATLKNLEQQLEALKATMEDGPLAEPQEGRGGRPYK